MNGDQCDEDAVDNSICVRRACPYINFCPKRPMDECALCDVLECGEIIEELRGAMIMSAGSQNSCLGDLRELTRLQALYDSQRLRVCVHA